MLQNNVCIIVIFSNLLFHPFEQCHSARIVRRPSTNIISRIYLGKPLRQVKTITIKMIFINPVMVDSIHEVLRVLTLMIKIKTYIKRVSCYGVKPWTVISHRVFGWIPIHFNHSIQAKGMIENHIEYHGHSLLVCSFNEFFQIILGTIIFIRRKEIHRIIAPTFISFKLHYWHELNRIYSKAF